MVGDRQDGAATAAPSDKKLGKITSTKVGSIYPTLTTVGELGLQYAVGIRLNTSVWTLGSAPVPPGSSGGESGRPRSFLPRALGHPPVGVKSLILALDASRYRTLIWCEGRCAAFIQLAKETVRKLMTDAGLWVPRRQRPPKVYQPRARRACLGELIQIDGSDHRWFEERTPACTLLVYVDDATSRLMMLHFTQTDRSSATSRRRECISNATASRWRSIATSTACSAAKPWARPAAASRSLGGPYMN